MIPYGKQDITSADINAVVESLKLDFITQGDVVPRFEKSVCDYTNAKYNNFKFLKLKEDSFAENIK